MSTPLNGKPKKLSLPRLTIRLSAQQRKALKRMAVEQDTTVHGLLGSLIQSLVEKQA